VNPRVVFEHDESEEPGLLHAVRRAWSTNADDPDTGSAYQTMCGEMLYSVALYPSRKRGIPTCLRCTLALVEEAFLEPPSVETMFP